MNLENHLKYKYKEKYSCHESGCDEICRCMEIIKPKITEVDLNGMVDFFYELVSESDEITKIRNSKIDQIIGYDSVVDKYCIHRILTIMKVWSEKNYHFLIESGWYGEIIQEINLKNFDSVLEECRFVYNLDSINGKIRRVLELEYGVVNFNSTNFNLVEIDKTKITNKNNNYISKIVTKMVKGNLSYYSNEFYKLPRGVVKRIGENYTIIDGYHRISKSESPKIWVWEIVNN